MPYWRHGYEVCGRYTGEPVFVFKEPGTITADRCHGSEDDSRIREPGGSSCVYQKEAIAHLIPSPFDGPRDGTYV